MQEITNLLWAVLPMILLITPILWFFRRLRQPKKIISENDGMRKISTSPSIFGGSSSDAHYYYDDQFFYEIKNNVTHKISLAEIIRIKPGSTKINNRRNRCVTWLNNGVKKEVRFFHNLTLFNNNFAGFLVAVKRENPGAEVKDVSPFNI